MGIYSIVLIGMAPLGHSMIALLAENICVVDAQLQLGCLRNGNFAQLQTGS